MSSTIAAVDHVLKVPAMVEFGRFRVVPHRRELLADGRAIKLGGRDFDVLMVLIEASGAVISKDELMSRVWAGRIVEENTLQGAISALRKAFGTDRDLINTVAGRGYQFTGEISLRSAGVPGAALTAAEPPLRLTELIGREEEAGTPEALSAPVEPVLALPDNPSIAVLPFQNMSGDPEQEYFADGMVEEIITALSRVRWLFVIARNSTFTYKGQAIDVKQVGRELGVRYVLEGSVRKAAGRVRITAQLIDTLSGRHLWADHFDGSLEDVFDLQDMVASSVAGVIEPALQAAETARSANRPTNDLTAYDLYLRAYAMTLSSAARIPEALHLMKQVIARGPRYGPALAWAAICCVRLLLAGRSEDPAADRLEGADFARRALEVAGDDPGILANAALALAYFGEDIGAMMALVDRALVLNPNFARGWYISGLLRSWAGQPDIAIAHVETSLRLGPRARVGTSMITIGAAHLDSRRFDEAVPKLLLAIQEDPSSPQPYRLLAACYAHMGRLDDAREVVARLRAITSVVIPDASYLRNAEHRELFLSGLRLAAGEAPSARPFVSPRSSSPMRRGPHG
jgi:TolB-like protein/DNA-binding winged helix-turn-helix (wHTH) protein